MEERRKFQRFPLALNGGYSVGKSKRKDCKITNISREGTRIIFYSREKIDVPSDIQLEIDMPLRATPLPATVTLRWAKEVHEEKKFDLMGGCEFKDITDEDKWSLLDHAYDKWYANKIKASDRDVKPHPGLD